MSATPPPGLPNFGGWQPSALAQFGALGGWRETVSGLVVPSRFVANSHAGAQSAAASTTTSFALSIGGTGNPGVFNQVGGTGTAPALDPLNDNDCILVESFLLGLASASVGGALSVVATQCGLLRAGATTALAFIPFNPPTLNAIPTGTINNLYSAITPFIIGTRELFPLSVQAGGSIPTLPIADWQLTWGITVNNSNAGAQTFVPTMYLVYRRFQGVSPS